MILGIHMGFIISMVSCEALSLRFTSFFLFLGVKYLNYNEQIQIL
jgi:hypothetical protein